MYRISYRFLVPGWSAKPLVSAHDRIMGTYNQPPCPGQRRLPPGRPPAASVRGQLRGPPLSYPCGGLVDRNPRLGGTNAAHYWRTSPAGTLNHAIPTDWCSLNMIELNATELGTWLQIVSAFAAVQFVASALKNFRAARRLVPIGSVDPTMVEKYKTVPVCFVGSDNRLTRIILWVYSRMWLGRKAKKQAFVCDHVFFFDEDGAALVRDRSLSAGQRVRIRVAVGESDSHVYRSAKRCAVGNELLLAVAFRASDMTEYQEYVRCISVRARCRRVPEEGADVPKSLLEWQVMDPVGIGARTDSRLAWSEVPQSALWLFSREVCDDKNGRVLPSDRLELPGSGNRLRLRINQMEGPRFSVREDCQLCASP